MPPAYDPPDGLAPRELVLPAGTELWRCHGTAYPASSFKHEPTRSPFRGGRFDATADDPFPFLYAAGQSAVALAEVLLRSLEFGGPAGQRLISPVRAARHVLSRVRTTAPLRLIRLIDERDLSAVCQDSWLLEADALGYAHTRYWTQALRRSAGWAQGMVWQSRRCRPHHAYVLFGDRCGPDALRAEPEVSFDLGTEKGRRTANRLLARAGLRSAIATPRDGTVRADPR